MHGLFLFWLPAQSSEQPIEAGKQEQMEPEENEFLDCSFGVSSVWACFLFGYSYIIVLSIIHADPLRIGIGSIRKKEVNAMTCDEALYRQYLSGDDEGLNALMKKYGDPLTLYIDGYLHDVHESEELMLDVFAYLFTKKPRIRDGGLKAYLYKAARHMALRHKSKRKPLFSLDALTNEPDGRLLTEEIIRTEERNRILHFCMSEMNPDYREVLYLTYFEDMSYAQAAEVTGKTVKQITNMVYRGKESLRRLLEREGITNAES